MFQCNIACIPVMPMKPRISCLRDYHPVPLNTCHHGMPQAASQNPQRLTSPKQSRQSAACVEKNRSTRMPSRSPHLVLSHLDMKRMHVRIVLITAQHLIYLSSSSGTISEHLHVLKPGHSDKQTTGGEDLHFHFTHSRHSGPC